MDKKIKNAIEEYQCPGCMDGNFPSCYKKRDWSDSCDAHHAGTSLGLNFKIFLGMPKGFNRTGVGLGDKCRLQLDIFPTLKAKEKSGWGYDEWNIPVWKHLTKKGHTFIRGLSPRNNAPFLHVILEDCMDKIECFEVSEKLISEMD